MTYRLRSLIVFCFAFVAVLTTFTLPAAAQSNDYIVSFEQGTPKAGEGRRCRTSRRASIQLRDC
jgi:hypothetical protein